HRAWDAAPWRLADVGHDHLEAHPGEEGIGDLAEVRGTELADPRLLPALLLAGVTELEGGVVVAAVFVVDQPQPLAVVQVVLGQQVVMARDGGQWMDAERRLYPRQPIEPVAIPVRDQDRALIDDAQVALGRAEHVEVVAEPRACMELAQRFSDPGRDARRAERLDRHRPGIDPGEDEHVPLWNLVEARRPEPAGGGA